MLEWSMTFSESCSKTFSINKGNDTFHNHYMKFSIIDKENESLESRIIVFRLKI